MLILNNGSCMLKYSCHGTSKLILDDNGARLWQMKLPEIQKIMMEFEKQSEIMEMKEEMMNDAIDDAMGEDDDEEER